MGLSNNLRHWIWKVSWIYNITEEYLWKYDEGRWNEDENQIWDIPGYRWNIRMKTWHNFETISGNSWPKRTTTTWKRSWRRLWTPARFEGKEAYQPHRKCTKSGTGKRSLISSSSPSIASVAITITIVSLQYYYYLSWTQNLQIITIPWPLLILQAIFQRYIT